LSKKKELPLGEPVDPPPGRVPDLRMLYGASVSLVAFDPLRDGAALYEAASDDATGETWAYMGNGPFASAAELIASYQGLTAGSDPLFYAIVPKASGEVEGVASYLRITPAHGVIEIGHIYLSPRLQKTRAATEAIYLMIHHAFDDLGYRRVEWKCNDLNEGSKRAAERYGFTYEGTFRQHLIVKGRNRDTAWFAIVDKDWHKLREAYKKWLADDNFDDAGKQRQSLSKLTRKALGS